ncbi:F162A protein, partial [Cettia cetti]|nr:F162A protein [Cettia cetti]
VAALLPLPSLPDRAVRLLGRNIPSVLRMTEGVDPKISRRLCIKPQQDLQTKGKSRSASGVPGYKPTEWERRFLLWAGHFKKPEDIPETVSLDTVRAAKTTLRVKFSYVMIALTIVGCIVMVVRGKQAMKRHESLTSINLQKKAQLKAESESAKS